MNDIERDGIGTVVTEAVEAAATDTEAVYVTFDIDGVDPSVAPGTGTPVPGGGCLHTRLCGRWPYSLNTTQFVP